MEPIIVCVWVVVHDGKVLLIKRANPEWDLVYQFPAGKKESWEDAAQGAERETVEETWIKVKANIDLWSRIHPYTKIHISYRWCKYIWELKKKAIIKSVIEEVIWVSIDTIDRYIKTDIFLPVQEYLSQIKMSDDS